VRNLPKCVRCHSEYTYEDGAVYICPECGHEWPIDVTTQDIQPELIVKDAHGNLLLDGDNITIIKDIKIKGSSSVIKIGLKIKNIRVVEGADGHNIDAKVPGFGPMMLKSEFVKKSN
jgi:protein PhnA